MLLPLFFKRLARAMLFGPLVGLSLGAAFGGCALGNISRSDCESDTQCVSAFGPGSTCQQGFCTEGTGCETGQECRATAGGGACVSGQCQSTFPTDDACTRFTEPPDLLSQPATGSDAPLVIGSIFSLDDMHDQALTMSIRLAVREINRTGGLDNGQKIGVVFCDNGGMGNTATGTARTAMNTHAVDYLAGTLGAPVIVGPLTSNDAIDVVTEVTKKLYPTAVISPSATSPALTDIPDRLHPSDKYGLFWRTCPSDQLQGDVLANNVIGLDTMIKSVTVIYIHDSYGEGLATGFQSAYGLPKTTLVPYEDTTPDSSTDLATLATTAEASGGDAVLLIAEHGSTAVKLIEGMAGKSIVSKPWFFTDGSEDKGLLDKTLPTWVQTLIKNAKGTAPASPMGQNYDLFNTNLMSEFGIAGNQASFVAHAYDATYVGAYGLVWAARSGPKYDGLDVAAGMAQLSSGAPIRLGSLDWLSGKSQLASGTSINIDGTSGPLDFNAQTGEAPGAILVWGVDPSLTKFTELMIVPPS